MSTFNIIRTIATLITVIAPQLMMADSGPKRLLIDGQLRADVGGLSNAFVVMTVDGVTQDTVRLGTYHFQMALDAGHEYKLRFEAEGRIAKELVFVTEMPSDLRRRTAEIYPFEVTLNRQDQLEPKQYDGPVAMIQFDHQRGEFEVVAGRRVKLVPVERTARKELTPFEDPTDALADWVIDQARTAGTLDH